MASNDKTEIVVSPANVAPIPAALPNNDAGFSNCDAVLPKGKTKSRVKGKPEVSSVKELLSFLQTPSTKLIFGVGCIGAVGNGLVYPALAYLFSDSFSQLSGKDLGPIRHVAFTFLVVGTYAFVMSCIQDVCLELAATKATRNFRLTWFRALLRQDSAFFDVNDVSGFASSISPNANRVRRGLGRKFGEGVQFFVTGLGGVAFAFYVSWRVALIVLAILPFVSASAVAVLKINQSQTTMAMKSYAGAGKVAYQSFSNIRTVLSLNAVSEMIRQYAEATTDAYNATVKPLMKAGVANGSMLGSFIVLYAVITLYGTSLIYKEVRSNGCDPTAAYPDNPDCQNTGADVLGAMLGVAFAAQGMSQVANFIETFTAALSACYPAMQAINRTVGSPSGLEHEVIINTPSDDKKKSSKKKTFTTLSRRCSKNSLKSTESLDEDSDEEAALVVKALLPKYEIDSSTEKGLKPALIKGGLSFENVTFAYPTRPNNPVFDGFNLEIPANTTVALVGPRGGGKSTIVSLIERFYDPKEGMILLDGIDIRDINVKHLRDQIGLVSQEPTLFATSISGNIAYGCPGATQDQVEQAAKLANAHDFISAFPEGYQTQVGDKGAQLSGGQKQRIAIARVLIKSPKILLLDEATSALDSESELVVQETLDKLLEGENKRTTVIIAHRLTTIRKADTIAVVSGGKVVEIGSHEDLMLSETGHYRSLVKKQYGKQAASEGAAAEAIGGSEPNSRNASSTNLVSMDSSNDFGTTFDSQAKVSSITQLSFADVTFSYPTRPLKNVFSHFSLSIKKGETLALVGPSGGGKSTTVALIERFYDPNIGVVQFEGVDVKELSVYWLRDQIGYVAQEPTLFNDTIGKNIAYGYPGASQNEIETAAKQANAHEFIMSCPNGYNTQVGEGGTQLSGGQKQRVAIARALVKNPKILILDEATSALDSISEAIVQAALDELMASNERTTIVIAHRLSTTRNADRIAFIAGGRVKEIGTHEELISKTNGRYKRLVESQQRETTLDLNTLRELVTGNKGDDDDEGEEKAIYAKEIEEEAKKSLNKAKALAMALQDWKQLFVGSLGALLAGGVFPAWGVMFGILITLLYEPVLFCDSTSVPPEFATCQEYWNNTADYMQQRSFRMAGYWAIIVFGCLLGNGLVYQGFGIASERMNKRIRDSAFASLIRQEIAFFDKQSVGSITSQLQEDAARIHTFSGEPIRTYIIQVSSVASGLIISFVYMWPFALLAVFCIPLMGVATTIDMKQMMGEDIGDDAKDGKYSPGCVVVETLLNMRTVAALGLEEERYNDYIVALDRSEGDPVSSSIKSGTTSGFSMLIQTYVNALEIWWGGWLLVNRPNDYDFQDFLISMFALLFALFGLGASQVGATDRKEAELSAGRIFYLMDRKSAIDPLSDEGKKLD